MDSSAVYCGVNPHRLATLTSSTTFPLYAASGAGCPSMEFNVKLYTVFPSAITATAPISRHSSSFLTFPPSLCSTLFCAHRQSPLRARGPPQDTCQDACSPAGSFPGSRDWPTAAISIQTGLLAKRPLSPPLACYRLRTHNSLRPIRPGHCRGSWEISFKQGQPRRCAARGSPQGGVDAFCIFGCGHSPDPRNPGSRHHRDLLCPCLWHWLLFFEKGAHLRGIFPCRPQHRLVRYRRLAVCLEHFHGTFHRLGGFRRHVGPGRRPF